MPVVKIEIPKGYSSDTISKLMEVAGNAIVETLKLPSDDRNIRVTEYEPAFFSMKAPYTILIEITLFAGRTKETKKQLFQNITNSIENTLNINKESIFIVLNEQPLDNWGVRGGVQASELKLDFIVNI